MINLFLTGDYLFSIWSCELPDYYCLVNETSSSTIDPDLHLDEPERPKNKVFSGTRWSIYGNGDGLINVIQREGAFGTHCFSAADSYVDHG